jgi:hypothetical protein
MRVATSVAPLLTVVLLVAACASAGGPGVEPTPRPSPDPEPALRLRLTTTQALPPASRFNQLPHLAVTHDAIVIVPAMAVEDDPAPLVPLMMGRTISDAGWDQVVAIAVRFGLLDGDGDYTGGSSMPGAPLGRIEILVRGEVRVLVGHPEARLDCLTQPCDPLPGTPEAFGELWRRIIDLPGWLGTELGPEAEYVPDAYALLLEPAPRPSLGEDRAIADWPLEPLLDTFGGPVGTTGTRCGVASGRDADRLRPSLEGATTATLWAQDPGSSAPFRLGVRPMVPGEPGPCVELFGPGG